MSDIEHDFFGTLSWNEQYKYWSATIPHGDRTVDISINVPEDAVTAHLPKTQDLVHGVLNVQSRIELDIADQLLDVFNDTWNDGAAIDRQQFAESISLDIISVSDSGDAELWYDDGGLFLEHAVLAYITSDLKIESACLAG